MLQFCKQIFHLTAWTYLYTVILLSLSYFFYYFQPDKLDFSQVTFTYQLDPRNLIPFNPNFTTFNILLDGHVHTTFSDGKLSPRQVVDWAIASGYNSIVVTDHNTVQGGLEVQRIVSESPELSKKLVVIPGMEYTNCRVHMNFIGINQTVPLCAGSVAGQTSCPFISNEDLKLVVDSVHALGGLVTVNHLPWSLDQDPTSANSRLYAHPTLQELIEIGIDGVEVVNQNVLDFTSLQTVQKAGLLALTGSDMHTPRKPFAWTVLNAANFTADAVMTELKAKRTSFLFDPIGLGFILPQEALPKVSLAYQALAPLSALSDTFKTFLTVNQGIPSFQHGFCRPPVVSVYWLSFFMYILYVPIVLMGMIAIFKLIVFLNLWLVEKWNSRRETPAKKEEV